jgi:hypothetical protein
MSRIPLRIGATVAVAAAAALSFTPVVHAAPKVSPACDTRVNNTHAKLMECITLEGVREHQAAFQSIADANGGNRAAGTSGYDDSVDYVVEKMEAAGYDVTLDEFPFTYVAAATLRQTAPVDATYDTGPFTGTGYGPVTAAVTAVDINLAMPRANNSGCEAADFAGFRPATSPSCSAARARSRTRRSTPPPLAPRASSSSTRATIPLARV